MSTDGQVLYKKNREDASQLSNTQLERKQRMEDDLRQKVQSMLEQVVGSNRVLAQGCALSGDGSDSDCGGDLQPGQRSHQEPAEDHRKYGRQGSGRRERQSGRPSTSKESFCRILPRQEMPQNRSKQSNRQREVVNYEINKITKQVVQVPGNIKQLSVAVIVDGKYDNKPGADGKPKQTYIARTAEEMKSMEDLVRKAVGYNETRGDQITVSNIPFASDTPGAEMVKAENKYLQLFKSWQRMLLNIGLAALVLVFVIRPFMRKFRQVADDIRTLPAPSSGPTSDEQITAMLLDKPFGQLSFRKKSTALESTIPTRQRKSSGNG